MVALCCPRSITHWSRNELPCILAWDEDSGSFFFFWSIVWNLFVPQFPPDVSPQLHEETSEGHDQKLLVIFRVFVCSSPAPDPLLEGAGLDSDSSGQPPRVGGPLLSSVTPAWPEQHQRATLQRDPLKRRYFLSWKEGKLQWKRIVLYRQCSLRSKRELGL